MLGEFDCKMTFFPPTTFFSQKVEFLPFFGGFPWTFCPPTARENLLNTDRALFWAISEESVGSLAILCTLLFEDFSSWKQQKMSNHDCSLVAQLAVIWCFWGAFLAVYQRGLFPLPGGSGLAPSYFACFSRVREVKTFGKKLPPPSIGFLAQLAILWVIFPYVDPPAAQCALRFPYRGVFLTQKCLKVPNATRSLFGPRYVFIFVLLWNFMSPRSCFPMKSVLEPMLFA